MRLFLRHGTADKTRKRRLREIEGPRSYQREFQGLTISRSPEILPSRMLFRIPAFPAHSVSLSSRTDAAFWAQEFTHFASGDFIAIHFGVRFMWWCADIHIRGASSAKDSRAIGRGKCRPLFAKLYPPELPRKFIWIYHRSLVNAHKGASSLRRSARWSEINRPSSCIVYVKSRIFPRVAAQTTSATNSGNGIYRFYFN